MADTARSELVGREVESVRKEKIGSIVELRVHGDGEEPNWAVVKTGLLGVRRSLIPLQDIVEVDDVVRLVYEKDHVENAPEVELGSDDRIEDEDVDALQRHYGLERDLGAVARDEDDEIELPRETRDARPPGMDESDDNPLTKRRLERAREFGVPSAQDDHGEGGDGGEHGEGGDSGEHGDGGEHDDRGERASPSAR